MDGRMGCAGLRICRGSFADWSTAAATTEHCPLCEQQKANPDIRIALLLCSSVALIYGNIL